MFKWLSGKKSKGGSDLLDYSNAKPKIPKFGIPDEEMAKNAEIRESIYEKYWGKSDQVYHEMPPLIPHIDVYQFPPNKTREWWVLASSGMSDLEMILPPNAPRALARAEIIMYVNEPKVEYMNIIRHFAHFPHDNETWLGIGHTIPNGIPAKPIFPGSLLNSIVFLPTIVKSDYSIEDEFKKNKLCVNVLHMAFITGPECDHKLEHGIDSLYKLFDKNKHSFILDENRRSYI
jgi:hypothetical protein